MTSIYEMLRKESPVQKKKVQENKTVLGSLVNQNTKLVDQNNYYRRRMKIANKIIEAEDFEANIINYKKKLLKILKVEENGND